MYTRADETLEYTRIRSSHLYHIFVSLVQGSPAHIPMIHILTATPFSISTRCRVVFPLCNRLSVRKSSLTVNLARAIIWGSTLGN